MYNPNLTTIHMKHSWPNSSIKSVRRFELLTKLLLLLLLLLRTLYNYIYDYYRSYINNNNLFA